MTYLFDTDHLSIIQRRRGPDYAMLALRASGHVASDFAFAVVSFHE